MSVYRSMENPFNRHNEPNQSEMSTNGQNRSFFNTVEKAFRNRRIIRLEPLERTLVSLSPFERLLLYGLSILLAGSTLTLVALANRAASVEVPSKGGELIEGVVGTPRFINPLLASSEVDRDLTALVYSGLTRILPDGSIVPDLAERFDISEDGTVYTFTLREDAVFHDNTKITSADVQFTILQAQNAEIKSPRRADWEGVSIALPDERTIVFTLPNSYAPFLENTTLGILPRHLWQDISGQEFAFDELNAEPIGSGPFKIGRIQLDREGTPTRYTLNRFDRFTLGAPYLNRIIFIFYPNDEALSKAAQTGIIDSFAGSVSNEDESTALAAPLSRVFAVFFNQNHSALLADASVRKALDMSLDKKKIADTILSGRAVPTYGPIPPGVLTRDIVYEETVFTDEERVTRARRILENGGWKDEDGVWTKGGSTLSLTLSTADTPQLVATAQEVANAWRSIGVNTTVEVYSLSELNTSIIRPRQYDAVLFGEVVGRSVDLFAFWHSSQRNDPGLNLALYTNSRADKLLSDARATVDREAREELYREFSEMVNEDAPAAFLYSPEFVYVVPNTLKGVTLGSLTSPSERFLTSHLWHRETERVWEIFID